MAFVGNSISVHRQVLPRKQASVCSPFRFFKMSSATNSAAPAAQARPAQVVRRPLPRVLIYDHCPFCLRVRYILGAKHVKHDLVWLRNDDVDTPTALVGRKVVPIFQAQGLDGPAVAESMDICKQIDSDPSYGPTGFFRPASSRKDISQWMSDNADASRRLLRPRHVMAPLPEFVFEEAREAFIRNHPLANPSDYDENIANSPNLVASLQSQVDRLSEMVFCEQYCTEGGLSFDDVDLFPRLRSYSIIRGLKLPERLSAYINYHSQLAEIPLYHFYAM